MAEQVTKIKLTAEGKKRYETELNELKTVKRKEIADNLQSARAQGDLSENSEYDEAKNDQAKLEARIKELESILRNVEVIDESELSSEKVHLGSTVKVHDREFDEDAEYQIVSSSEADPFNGKISDESPVGMALIDKTVGEVVKVETPGGETELVILEITL
ncbi:MAG: transcription elongation factor GreA [Clostridia bacterium]|nr:transcription elongation factor GreA [Clostridia bacterium]